MNEKLERWWLHIISSQRCNLSSFYLFCVTFRKRYRMNSVGEYHKKEIRHPPVSRSTVRFRFTCGTICLWDFICHPNTKEVNIIFLLGTQKLRNYIWRFSCNLSLTEKWFHWNMTTSRSGDYACSLKRFFFKEITSPYPSMTLYYQQGWT